VPATYNPDIMVCPREADANSYGDTASGSTGSPPRRCSTSSRRTSSSRHSRRGTGTTPKLQPSSGVWNYHGPKNIYYAVVTVLYWAPQPSYPYATTTAVLAHQDPLATNPNGTICLLGVG